MSPLLVLSHFFNLLTASKQEEEGEGDKGEGRGEIGDKNDCISEFLLSFFDVRESKVRM